MRECCILARYGFPDAQLFSRALMNQKEFPPLALDSSAVSMDLPPGPVKAYEIKGFLFSILAMCLKHTDAPAIERQLKEDLPRLPDIRSEPLVLDMSHLAASESVPDFPALLTLMRGLGLAPIGVCNGSEAQRAAAAAVGLPVLEGGAAAARRPATDQSKKQDTAKSESSRAPVDPPTPASTEKPPTHIVNTPVRTGQRVFAGDGDLTLLASVNPGAEVLATGSIHVYGPLRGRALAGVAGDTKARIFTRCMEAELVSIAGCFCVIENDLGPELQGKPAQIYLDGERIVIAPIK
jgi:septum site-determining protein MinC